jgi:hypothetical protein
MLRHHQHRYSALFSKKRDHGQCHWREIFVRGAPILARRWEDREVLLTPFYYFSSHVPLEVCDGIVEFFSIHGAARRIGHKHRESFFPFFDFVSSGGRTGEVEMQIQ